MMFDKYSLLYLGISAVIMICILIKTNHETAIVFSMFALFMIGLSIGIKKLRTVLGWEISTNMLLIDSFPIDQALATVITLVLCYLILKPFSA